MGKTARSVGVLHPGEMGISVAASLRQGGHQVYWVSEGRSEATRQRAEQFDLTDAVTFRELCERCEIVVSVCPPHAAEAVARAVLENGFQGLYLDANAISPQRATRIAHLCEAQGSGFIDGGIIGGPAWERGRTWLYLSGPRVMEGATLFEGGRFMTRTIGDRAGQASALKMCYAAYTKGTTALLCELLAAADALDVRQELEQQWSEQWPGFSEEATNRITRATAKAWRFVGEMKEISATFEDAGLPGDFHRGAGKIYQRLAGFKGRSPAPSMHEVMQALLDPGEG